MHKVITPVFEVRGKRRKLVGFTAEVDGVALGTFDTRDEAQAAADDCAYTALTRNR